MIDKIIKITHSKKMVDINECKLENVNLLAEMNKQLIEDEKSDNIMDISQLKNRMVDFLNNGYKAFLFSVEKNIVGYALCDITKRPIYLRQFFIKREERRKYYGKESFKKLLEKVGTNEIEIDVYSWNKTGKKFWESIGFTKQWIRMKYKN
jgi:N-acetylglutamate synthase-like GNAT family acetyltransferase